MEKVESIFFLLNATYPEQKIKDEEQVLEANCQPVFLVIFIHC